MSIRMSHPQHGFMDVYVEAEVVANEANGWVREVVVPRETSKPLFKPAETELLDVGLADDLRTRYIAKYGRPPHHRMTDKTIADALED